MKVEEPVMNKYGLLAQEYWRKHVPSRYAELESPEAYFEALGEQAATQINDLAVTLEARLPKDDEGLERVARLRAAQKQAEEVVLAELVYSTTPEWTSQLEELDQMLGELPSPAMIGQQLAWIQSQAEDEAEMEGRSETIYSEEQIAQREQLEALLPLVTVPSDLTELSEAEISKRVQELHRFWDPQTRALISL